MARTLTEERLYVQDRKQRQYAIDHPELVTPPRTYISNTTGGTYTGPNVTTARAGADDHQQHKSFGLRAQIEVRTA